MLMNQDKYGAYETGKCYTSNFEASPSTLSLICHTKK